jgi:hypothetical protein
MCMSIVLAVICVYNPTTQQIVQSINQGRFDRRMLSGIDTILGSVVLQRFGRFRCAIDGFP